MNLLKYNTDDKTILTVTVVGFIERHHYRWQGSQYRQLTIHKLMLGYAC